MAYKFSANIWVEVVISLNYTPLRYLIGITLIMGILVLDMNADNFKDHSITLKVSLDSDNINKV